RPSSDLARPRSAAASTPPPPPPRPGQAGPGRTRPRNGGAGRGAGAAGLASGPWACSQVGPQAQVDLEAGVGIIQAVGDVDPYRAHRLAPACADADADPRAEVVVEGVAGVSEGRAAPGRSE